MAEYSFDIVAEDKTGETFDRIEERAEEALESVEENVTEAGGRFGDLMGNAIAIGITAAATAALESIVQTATAHIDALEQRALAIATTAGRTTAAEEEIITGLELTGFSEDVAATAVRGTRALGFELDQNQRGALANTLVRLETAGINTRFAPQLATAFEYDDPYRFAADLAGIFDVGTQAGVDPEEIFSEIADNPQVYAGFGSATQAAAFLTQQGAVPSEVTQLLEQGILSIPEQFDVTADVGALFTINPTTGQRVEQQRQANPFLDGLLNVLDEIPIVGGLAEGAAFIAESIAGDPADIGYTPFNFNDPSRPDRFYVPGDIPAPPSLSTFATDAVEQQQSASDRLYEIALPYLQDRRTPGIIGSTERADVRQDIIQEYGLIPTRDDASIDRLVSALEGLVRALGFGVQYDSSRAVASDEQWQLGQGYIAPPEYNPRFGQ